MKRLASAVAAASLAGALILLAPEGTTRAKLRTLFVAPHAADRNFQP